MSYKLTQLVHEAREKDGKSATPSVIEIDITISEEGEEKVEQTFHFKPLMRLGKKRMKLALKAIKRISGSEIDDLGDNLDQICAFLTQLLPETERKAFEKIDLEMEEILAIQSAVNGDILGKSSDSLESSATK